MPAVSQASFFAFQAFTSAGDPANGYRLYTYAAGTTTHKVAYTEPTGTTSHTYVSDGAGGTYIALNERGELPAPLFLQAAGYDLALKTSAGATVWTLRAYGQSEGASALDTALRAELADSTSATAGAGMVDYDRDNAYAGFTVGRKLKERISVQDDMTTSQYEDVTGRDRAIDVTGQIQDGLDWLDTGVVGAFRVDVPDGAYLITGSGTEILTVQDGTKVEGASLEGTGLWVDAASTATAVIQDDGSAAKIELYNLQIYGQDNLALTAGIKLGATTQFGTYGSLDNLMVRDMPNATAYDLDTNIAVCGRLYSMDTKDGLISDDGGSGLHVNALTPLGFTGYGAWLAAGDSITFMEAEAPAADSAVPLRLERGGSVHNYILSIQASREVQNPIYINTTYVDDFFIGPTKIFRSSSGATGTSRYGNSGTPADSGTATAGGANSLTDTAKTWGLDQWKGGACFITSGTGSGQWQRILSNTRHTLTLEGSWATNPDATSVYKLDYFIKFSGGGYAHSESMTAYWPASYSLSVTNEARVHKLVHGLEAFGGPAPTIASATTIAPTTPVAFISGVTTIQTITAPSPISATGGTITLIPTGAWSTGTSGNIAIASTGVVSKAMVMTYDATTEKWYPSY